MSDPERSVEDTPGEPSLGFEAALERLDEVVDALAGGDLDLEVAMARYEEGVKLLRICSERLDAARLRLRALETTTRGVRERPLDLEDAS